MNSNNTVLSQNKSISSKILILFVALFSFFTSFAQLSDLHYLPPLTQQGTPMNQQAVYLSTPSVTPFNVEVFIGIATIPSQIISISNGSPGVYTLGNGNNNVTMIFKNRVNTIRNDAGLRFQSPGGEDFFVNYRGTDGSQGASLTSKGRAALGTKFKWGGVPLANASNQHTGTVGIMATKPGTIVTVSGYDPAIRLRNGSTSGIYSVTPSSISYTLNAGQSFVLESVGNAGANGGNDDANNFGWIGADITSTEPIAVSNGNLVVGSVAGVSLQDAGIDQSIPIDKLGKDYVFIRGFGIDDIEFPLIIGTANNTDIFVNGSATPIATINEGEFFKIPGSNYSGSTPGSNMTVVTSKRAYAYQSLSGAGGQAGIANNGLNFIAPVNCLLPSELNNISSINNLPPAVVIDGSLTIIAPIGTLNSDIVVTDGTGAVLKPAPVAAQGLPWKTFFITGVTGNVSVTTTPESPIAVGVVGSDGFMGFAGYFSGFDTAPVVSLTVTGTGTSTGATPLTCFAPGNTITVDSLFSAYQWFKNGDTIIGATSQSYVPATPGEYFVTVTDAGGCSYDSDIIPLFNCATEVLVTKTADVDSLLTGDTVVFIIKAQNLGSDPVTNVVINEPLPAGLTFAAPTVSPGTNWVAPNWTVGDLAPGESKTFTISATADPVISTTNLAITNTISYTLTETESTANVSPDDLTETVIVLADADGDGVPNISDICPGGNDSLDNDNDGVPDFCDLDDDNDGILDTDETDCVAPNAFINNYASIATPAGFALDGTTQNTAIPGLTITHTSVPAAAPGNFAVYQYTVGSLNLDNSIQVASPGSSNTTDFIMDLSQPMLNMSHQAYDIDIRETLELKAYYQGVLVNPTGTILGSNITTPGVNTFGSIANGAEDDLTISVTLTYSGLIDRIVISHTATGNQPAFTQHQFFGGCLAIDTDNDGTPDVLDLDSDNDGCPDAIEGAGTYVLADLTGSAISGAVNTTTGVTTNAKGTQAFGDSRDASTVVCCDASDSGFPDADGDDVTDQCDLDDDNDGILDNVECNGTEIVTLGNFLSGPGANLAVIPGWSLDTSTIFSDFGLVFVRNNVRQTLTQSLTNVNPYGLGATVELTRVQPTDASPSLNSDPLGFSVFYDGLEYARITTLSNTTINATVSYFNGATGNVSFIPIGTVVDMQVNLPANISDAGDFSFVYDTKAGSPVTTNDDDLRIGGVSILTCADFDGDMVPDFQDLDSDNDGCPDALEGAGGFTPLDILNDSLTGGLDANGVPTVTSGGQATTAAVLDSFAFPACSEVIPENDSGMVNEDSPITIPVVANDSSAGAQLDTASLSIKDSANNGTLTVNPVTGEITYTPDSNFIGIDSFTYIICDTNAIPVCDSAVVKITVTAVTDTINVTTPEDSSYVLCDTLLNGFMADSIVVCDSGSNGTVSDTTGNCKTYIPNPGFIGNDTTCFIVCNDGVCDTTIVVITVGPGTTDTINVTTPEDSSYVLCDTLLNGFMADSIVVCDSGSNGTVSDTTGNCKTYIPNPGFIGNDTTCFIVCNDGVCDTTIVVITVGPGTTDTINVTTPEDSSYVLCDTLLNGFMADSIVVCDSGSNGTVSDTTGNCKTYIPNPGFIGNDTTCFIVCNDGVCDTTIVVITVGPGTTDTINVTTPEDSSYVLCDTLLNGFMADSIVVCDSGSNGTVSDTTGNCKTYIPNPGFIGNDTTCFIVCNDGVCDTTIVVITVGPGTTDTINVTTPEDSSYVLCDTLLNGFMADSIVVCDSGSNGTVSDTTGNCKTYIPNPGFIGNDTTCFIVCNDGVCDTTIVVITVGPGTTDTINVTTPEDSSYVLCDTLLNGFMADSIVVCDSGSNGTVSDTTGNCKTYIPNPGFIGNDTTCFIVCNDGVCDTTIVVITVGPGTTDTINVTTPEDSSYVLCDTLLNGFMADSIVVCDSGSNGTVSDTTGNCKTYIPNPGFIGNDTTCFIVCNDGVCDTTIVVITVGPGTTDTINVTTPEDSSIVFCDTTLNGFMADSVVICGPGSNGTSDTAGNCITYKPNPGFIGNDTTCFIVCNDGVCDTTIVVITVGPGTTDTINVTTPEDSSYVLCDTLLNGFMADSIVVCDSGSNGTVSDTTGNCKTYIPNPGFIGNDTTCFIVCNDGVCDTTIVVITVGPGTTDTINVTTPEDSSYVLCDTLLNGFMADSIVVCDSGSNGTVSDTTGNCKTYIPNPGFIGNDTTCFIVCNDGVCDTTIVVITVGPGTTDTINVTTPEDSSYVLCDTLLNGFMADSIVVCDSGSNGTVSDTTGNCKTYIPNPGFIGNDTTCFIVCNDGVCDTTIVVITVGPGTTDTINVTTPEDSSYVLCDTLLNGFMADSIVVCDSGSNGTVSDTTGNCKTYIPNPGFIGNDTTCFIVCNDGVCDTTIVVITVGPGTTDTINVTTPEDSSYVLCDTLLNGFMADSIVVCDSGSNGTVSDTTGNCKTYIPNPGFIGNDTTCFIVCNDGVCDTTIVVITVGPGTTDTINVTTPEDSSYVLCDTLLNGFMADSIVVCDSGSNGTVSDTTGNCKTYIPNPGFIGNDTTCFIVCNDGVCDTTIVVITVGPGTTDTINVTTPEDSSYVLCDTLLNGFMADSIVVCDSGSNGTVSDTTGNCKTYIPNPGFIGNDTTCFIVCNDGVCDTTIVVITVGPGTTDTINVTTPEDSSYVLCDTLLNGFMADSIVVCDSGSNGTVSDTTGNCKTYIPNPGFIGKDTTCFIVCNDGVCDTTIVVITVGPGTTDTINVTTPEDSSYVLCDTLLNGFMADSIVVCDSGSNGTVSDTTGNCKTYIPNPGFIGNDTTCFIVCNDGVCDTTIVVITVGPGTTDTINVTTPEDSSYVLCDTLLNGFMADSIVVCDSGSNGTVSDTTGNCKTYIPNPGFIGNDTTCFIVCNDGVCDTTIVVITVGPGTTDTINVTTPEDSSYVLCDTLLNGFMADSIVVCDSGSNGTVSDTTGNCKTYIPNPGFIGNDTTCFIVCNDGVCDTTIVVITVGPGTTDTINVTTPEDSSYVLCDTLLNGFMADSIVVCDSGSNGTVSDTTGNCKTYIPNPGFIGNDTTCFIVCNDGVCDTTIVVITVGPGTTDTINVTTPEDSSYVLCDTLLNGFMADSIVVCDSGSNGTVSDTTGNCKTYIPNPGFIGNDTTCFIVCNDGVCDTTIVVITVGPGTTDTINVTTPEDSSYVLCDTLLNGFMADSIVVCDPGNNGTVSDTTGNCKTYIPNANFIGNDTTCFIVCNDGICDTTIVIITVGPGMPDTLNVMILEDSSIVFCDTLLNGFMADSVVVYQGGNIGTSDTAGNCITYTGNPGTGGNDTAYYIVWNDGISDTTVVIIFIDPKPDLFCNSTSIAYLNDTGGVVIDTSFILDSIIDNNLDSVWISQSDFDCMHLGVNSVTVYARDSVNQIDSCIATITISDTISPDVVCKNASFTLAKSNFIMIDTSDVMVSVMDNCGVDSVWLSQTVFTCADLGDNMVSVIARDSSGNIDSCIATVTIEVILTIDTIAVQMDQFNLGTICLTQSELIRGRYIPSILSIPRFGRINDFNDTCFNYTQTSTTKYLDTASIIICDDCGICDTTVLIFVPAPDPDTIFVLPIPSSNSDTCVRLESSFMAGHYVNTCDSTRTSSSGVPVTITGLCVTYPVPAPVFTGDTVCIIVCDTIRNVTICDTTLIVYLPDTTPPTVVCKNDTVYLNSFGRVTIDTSTVLDTVYDNTLVNAVWLSNDTFNCSNVGANFVTVYARDTNRNLDSCIATVTVLDTVAPMAICQNITIELDSINGKASIVALDLDGGSFDNCAIASMVVNQTSFDCSHLGTNSVTFTVTDIYGNISMCIATVTVEDNFTPITYCPGDKQIVLRNTTCSYTMPDYTGEASGWDNCLGNGVEITQWPLPGTEIILENMDTTVTITATDGSGNMSTCSFQLYARCVKELDIPQFISPDGNGQNDTWEIPGLADYPENVVKVFNRWGNLVFEKKGYFTGWNGSSNINAGANRLMDSKILPEGTYFYIIDIGTNDFEPYVGYMQIKR